MISKEVFGLSGQTRYDGTIPRMRPMSTMFIIECRTCGFEPDDQDSLPYCPCPRCHASTWRRLPRPGALVTAVKW